MSEKIKKTEKKIGVYKNGKIVHASRNHDEVYDLATKIMNENFANNVWVATVGSFVNV